jgi:subfamily B ATP-binding cassette protein MsbA
MSVIADSSPDSALSQRSLGWKIIGLLADRRWTLTGLSALIFVTAGCDIAVPFLTQQLIDKILHSFGSNNSDATRTLLLAAGAIFTVTALTRLLRSFYNYQLAKAASSAEDKMRNAAFANFLHQDTAYHASVNTGEVVGALDRGGTAIFLILYEILGQNLVPPTLVLIGVLVSLFAKNPWIALAVFLPLPAYVLSIGRLGRKMHELEFQTSRAFEAASRESYDIASNIRIVKKFNRETAESKTQRNLLRVARDRHYRSERLWALIENSQSLIASVGRVGVIALGGYFVLAHKCSVGDYVLFIAMQDMVYGPISQLSIILPKLRRNLSRAERLFTILEARRSVQDARDAKILPPVQRGIEFANVSFRYPGSDRWTLQNVRFWVPAGATVALIGPSGSGKSTLVNLLQRLYDPQAGGILIDGCDLRDVTQHSLRSQIAVVPQEVDLFSRSVLENIAYGQDALNRAEVERAARLAQAHHFIQRCQAGYETQVGERGMKLSGGERQRIGIARAILRDPKILILDEATSHLDNESERLIQQAMERLTKGRTCFIIAHRLSTVRRADMVIVLSKGGIEAVGTHQSLWDTSPTYRKLQSLHLAERPKPHPSTETTEFERTLIAVGE